MKKKRIKVSSAKSKGRNFQKDIAKRISLLIGLPHGKDEVIESRPMGQSGVDVRLTADAKDRFPWSVEVKAQEKVNIWKAIKQAKENQMSGTDWIVFLKRSRIDPIVVLDIDVFFDLLRLIHSERKGR